MRVVKDKHRRVRRANLLGQDREEVMDGEGKE